MSNQVVVILRGLPGAGKSRKRDELYWEIDGPVSSVSADDYFERPDGLYSWKAEELGRAHAWCFRQFLGFLADGHSVIVDNTNMRRRDYRDYVEAAEARGVSVRVVVVGDMPATAEQIELYARRNSHGVPAETIFRMNQKWQPTNDPSH